MALSFALGAVAQAQSSCDTGITRAVGTKVGCKTKVIAQAQKKGVAADAAKLAKCEAKFASSCAKAQSKGDCTAQTQACDAIEAAADACVERLSGAVVQAQSSCDAGITKAVGTKVTCKTKVIAQAQKKGVAADPAKLAKCEAKFASSCAKAQSKGDCTAQTQACDAIEATADACVDSLTEESTTTTTSTTSSTTSTTMASCPVLPPDCNGFFTIPKGCPCSLNCSNCVGSVCNTVTGFCQ